MHGAVKYMEMITFDECFSFDHLMESAKDCLRGVRWKPSTQCFEVELLERVCALKMELDNETYRSKGFILLIYGSAAKRDISSPYIYLRGLCRNVSATTV